MQKYRVGLALSSCIFLALAGCEAPVVLHVQINSPSDPTKNEVHATGLKKGSVVTWTDRKQAFTVIFTSGSPCAAAGTGSGGANYYPSSAASPYTVTCTIANDASSPTSTAYPYVIDGSDSISSPSSAGPHPPVGQNPRPVSNPAPGDHCEGCIIDN